NNITTMTPSRPPDIRAATTHSISDTDWNCDFDWNCVFRLRLRLIVSLPLSANWIDTDDNEAEADASADAVAVANADDDEYQVNPFMTLKRYNKYDSPPLMPPSPIIRCSL
ncbi:unnamed protein product, partial [Ceratitis capitata]